MSKIWYPVIDYLTCTECSICIDKCPNGVYDVIKAPCPVVVNPTSCVEHCNGCGVCVEICCGHCIEIR
jgi:Pyruvate/2-oxoacid:ferredoxin oxidoreductase delta subunit